MIYTTEVVVGVEEPETVSFSDIADGAYFYERRLCRKIKVFGLEDYNFYDVKKGTFGTMEDYAPVTPVLRLDIKPIMSWEDEKR